jgi:hypothetical protein
MQEFKNGMSLLLTTQTITAEMPSVQGLLERSSNVNKVKPDTAPWPVVG